MNSHRRLAVWQLCGDLIELVYRLAKRLPPDERYVVVEQLKRAAWSVQNNLAEGNARRGRADRRRFFDMSLASLAEIDSMIGTLPRVHPDITADADAFEPLRRKITAALLAMGRNGRR